MKDTLVHLLEMLIDVRQFGLTHAAAFPAGSRGAELFESIGSTIEHMEAQAAVQESRRRAAKEATVRKRAAFRTLQDLMKPIARTAAAMAAQTPGLREKFRLPYTSGLQTWLAAARSFAADAAPLQEEFVRRGMDVNFVNDLNAQIEVVEAAVDESAQKTTAKVGATAAVAEAAQTGRAAVEELDAIARNVFREDPATLAEWESARHVERPTRHPDAAAPPDETPAAES